MSTQDPNEFISLYDHLGTAAGLLLGKQVWEFAKEEGAEWQQREIVTNTYKGSVMLYKRHFLVDLFASKKLNPISR